MQTIQDFRSAATVEPDLHSGIYDIEIYLEGIKNICNPTFVNLVRDNFLLDQYGHVLYLNSNPDYPPFTMGEIKQVYEAAKIVFAEYPLCHFDFDPWCAYTELGSPWVRSCKSPEMWAICYGRRLLEDDEYAITESDDTAKRVHEFCQDMVNIVGIPEEVIRENLAYICYDNEELTAKVEALF